MNSPDSHTKFTAMLSPFCAGISNARLYGANHPLVPKCIEKAYGLIRSLLEDIEPLTFFLVGTDIVLGDQAVLSPGAIGEKFAGILREKGVERVTFLKDLPYAEFLAFVESLTCLAEPGVQSQPNIILGKVEVLSGDGELESGTGMSMADNEVFLELLALRDYEIDRLEELYCHVKRTPRIDSRRLDKVVKRFMQGFRANINPLSLLASVKRADEYTYIHVVNVGILTISQAERLGFSGKRLHDIGIAAMLHDIGKVFIPDEIINKPNSLSPEERSIMETHTVKGTRYLLGLDGIPRIAVFAAAEHHLGYDGSGYPHIRRGWKPSVVAQMIAIADIFDAMRSRRIYKEPQPLSLILETLQKMKGTKIDPLLVDNFLKLLASGTTKLR